MIAELVHLVRNQLNYKTLEAATYTFLTSLHDDTLARLGPEFSIIMKKVCLRIFNQYQRTLDKEQSLQITTGEVALAVFIDRKSLTFCCQKECFTIFLTIPK